MPIINLGAAHKDLGCPKLSLLAKAFRFEPFAREAADETCGLDRSNSHPSASLRPFGFVNKASPSQLTSAGDLGEGHLRTLVFAEKEGRKEIRARFETGWSVGDLRS